MKAGLSGEREKTVYVTETGIVYHEDYHCTHLEAVNTPGAGVGVPGLRNEDGGKYYPCEHCAAQASARYL